MNNIPVDINAEVLLNHYPDETFDVEFRGHHSRNAYNDILGISKRKKKLQLTLGRNSLYNILPEYIFHPVDRFDKKKISKDSYKEEHQQQEEEQDNASLFFKPMDIMLLRLRADVRRALEQYTVQDKVMQDIIAGNMTDSQRKNRFIRHSIAFLPSCKDIRGDRTLLTVMIRKVFKDEDLVIELCRDSMDFAEKQPRYDDTVGSVLGDVYAGYGYQDTVLSYNIHYWSDDDCDENFAMFVNEVEEYRLFIQDYFLSVDSLLQFNICKDDAPLRLSDTKRYNYLNYNTNI